MDRLDSNEAIKQPAYDIRFGCKVAGNAWN